MAIIAVVWGFFEGFNYAVICEKIDRRYPSKNPWLDTGAIVCALVCLLFHPFSTSFWGIAELLTTFLAIYGMLIVKKNTDNAWGCVFAFSVAMGIILEKITKEKFDLRAKKIRFWFAIFVFGVLAIVLAIRAGMPVSFG